jgi:hypothetical protein
MPPFAVIGGSFFFAFCAFFFSFLSGKYSKRLSALNHPSSSSSTQRTSSLNLCLFLRERRKTINYVHRQETIEND